MLMKLTQDRKFANITKALENAQEQKHFAGIEVTLQNIFNWFRFSNLVAKGHFFTDNAIYCH